MCAKLVQNSDSFSLIEMIEISLKKQDEIEMSKNYNGNGDGKENVGNDNENIGNEFEMSKIGVKKLGDVVILGDGIAERMEEIKDEKGFCKPGDIHCSPALGGGCCPSMFPACCGNGIHCRKTGPC